MEGLCGEREKPWRVLEFYSGIGGLRYSLMEAGVDAEVIEAFDINDVANDVYEHNFGHRPCQGNIQTLSAADLDRYGADVWLLSPPCQPYTRQGLQKGSSDARAFSFLKILELIPECSRPPVMLFVENVVGFETSDTHEKMITMLQENHFDTQEFILSPLQFGVPYSRPRYFCLAKQKPLSFQKAQFDNVLLRAPGPILGYEESILTEEEAVSHAYLNKLLETTRPISDFLDACKVISEPTVAKISVDTEEESELVVDPSNPFLVPSSLVDRWGSAMDIVFPESRRCCCFTKSYFRYVKGTGSLLATRPASLNQVLSCSLSRRILNSALFVLVFRSSRNIVMLSSVLKQLSYFPYAQGNRKIELPSLQELHLRYFTPREVANFHSFPKDFQFPEHVSLRQRYALMGNSLSVGVVAPLLRYLFTHQPS